MKRSYFAREKVLYLVLVLMATVIVGRLFMLQVIDAAELKAKGIERRTSSASLLPERGKILDAQGNVLAQSIPVKEVYGDPRAINELIESKQTKWTKEEIAAKLSEILSIEQEVILEKLNRDLAWVNIANHVELEKADQIKALKLPGIGFSDQQKRVYPMDRLAASVLGIVTLDGNGAEGLEAFYNKELYGTPGYSSQQSLLNPSQLNEPAMRGADLRLTLDSTIQYLIEQQLDQLLETTQGKHIAILAMDPMTGRILGMGSRPTYNPNDYSTTDPEERRNLTISMSYEPGSTFKIITGAAALEEGTVQPDDLFEDPGYIQIGPRYITNWDSDFRPHGKVTFTEGMMLSSNVVLSQVGMNLGKETFYTYLKAFGFGSRTGIDIIGEDSALLVPQDQARDIDMATMSFGQANLVTPLQLLTAISSVANGGTLYKPYIVDKITFPDGTVQEKSPEPVRQVISKATAEQMTAILEAVVNEGTGAAAKIPGIRVAGKTGTAQKVDPDTKGYSKTDFIASFAAYAPADNPKIALLILIDTPQGESHQGGTLAGPVAKTIIEGTLQYYGIPVSGETPSEVSEIPETSFERPAPGEVVPERTPLKGESVVPDLTGLTMRQAGEKLAAAELHFHFSGTGLVRGQNPQPGKVVNAGTVINVEFATLEEILQQGSEAEPPPNP
ncbi:cell division protein FtsI (penicillin-binding protein 3)/stage V sporulation protein D (sporulation-specific penicillin-binding protein) [Desulfitobacterium sp. LBE]|uniref:penicillin-binding protein n=1 Tax=Desulfitobacterium sp. LBE TaxID=884086 RepID=UPI00119921DF|nr:penicillin-binding transpeptidase domain-containing protein [Desulfitobacterium sp. LBE]TWH56382.1 cell division protein FtsI (penicillin-binding protein 3)/stage V sporulation protein D (sporulation-specific penicillin-binding protein) [Desulfitobacterium sp. LBE]